MCGNGGCNAHVNIILALMKLERVTLFVKVAEKIWVLLAHGVRRKGAGMKYEDFEKFVREKCMYDTIYDDSNGRQVLIIQMLDAYGMVNKAQREWVRLTEQEHTELAIECGCLSADWVFYGAAVEQKLKEKNT